jgi:hypothetical protein
MARRATETARVVGEHLVGRTDELATLLSAVEHGPQIVFVHGIAGIGKSALLAAFAERARAAGTVVVRLDCRAMEPSERGFLRGLGAALGAAVATTADAAERLGALGRRVALALDTYEVFRLLDAWLRVELFPLLPPNVSLVLAGRDRPLSAWFLCSGSYGLPRNVTLGPLPEADALSLLERGGVAAGRARGINRFACGHPLALRLAAVAAPAWEDAETESAPPAAHRVVEELTRLYLGDVGDPLTRRALDAASVLRRTTLSLLGATLPGVEPGLAFERLRDLPFVESEQDGLHIHDLVRQAIALSLRAADPSRYQEYRRAAWRLLSAEMRRAGPAQFWRYTADMLYIIENPVVREAFFPTGAPAYVVEPARPVDGDAIREIVELHEGADAARLLAAWWERRPESFRCVRDQTGAVVGFYQMFDPADARPADVDADPIARAWDRHMRREPLPASQRAVFLRRWLGREAGEAPSPVQAACWLDIKRSYMEMRPRLRRVYLAIRDFAAYAPAARQLGIEAVAAADTTIDGAVYHTAMLDFGPSSVDGWLARQVAAELGVEDDDLLDANAHELVLDGRRVTLTPLEYSVFSYLYGREGEAVTRAALIENVWGYSYAGSNVVETVVRALRKKLGDRASAIETIRGVGYRFRRA